VVAGEIWTRQELTHYNGTKSAYCPITGKRKVSREHLARAISESGQRFRALPVEKDEGQIDLGTAPVVLVAASVKRDWIPHPEFTHVKYLLMPHRNDASASLFHCFMAGPTHGMIDSHLGSDLTGWMDGNRLQNILRGCTAGGRHYQPDNSYCPIEPDPNPPGGIQDSDENIFGFPFRRIVYEVEFCHRNGELLRIVGARALSNPYTSLFLAIEVWKKGKSGFGAIAILWEKDPVTQAVALLEAVDLEPKRQLMMSGQDST